MTEIIDLQSVRLRRDREAAIARMRQQGQSHLADLWDRFWNRQNRAEQETWGR